MSKTNSEVQRQKIEIKRPQWIIMALFVVLGVIYSVVTPVFEASDEIWHYPVVQHIATTGQLPVQEPGVETLWEQEGSQPPLYYLASAALTFWIDTSDLGERLWRNPHAKLGIPLDPDNRNMIIHTGAERFPWRGSVLAVHLIRFFGVGLGAVSVALAYELIRTTWPETPDGAMLGAAMMAFNPMFVFIAGSVNNDNLMVLLSTWTLLILARILQDGLTLRRAATLAIVLALSTITKVSGLTLIPIIGLGLLAHGLQTREWRKIVLTGIGLAGAWLVLASWWYARNLTLYGELLGLQTHVAVAGGREIALGALSGEWYGFWVSFWGLFGAVNILASQWVYLVYGIVTVAGIAGMLWLSWRKVQGRELGELIVPGLLALYILVVFVGVIRWTMLTYASQGRLMFPALAAISGLLGAGLVSLASENWRGILTLAVSVAMFGLAAIAPFLYIAPTYAPPPVVDAVPEDATPINVRFGDHLELVAVRTENVVATAGGRVPVTLYWRLEMPIADDYSLYLHALGQGYEEIGKIDSYPGGGILPTSRMPIGRIIEDEYLLELDSDIEMPTAVRVQIGAWNLESDQGLAPEATDGTPVDSVIVLAGVAIPERQTEPDPPIAQTARVGEFVELVGYAIGSDQLHPGATTTITLYWRGLASTEKDLTVFAHLVDESGTPIAQADGPPLAGNYPTTLWQHDVWIADMHQMSIPEGTPPGRYQLLVGLYDAHDPTYARVAAFGPDGQRYTNDAIPLETMIEIQGNAGTD